MTILPHPFVPNPHDCEKSPKPGCDSTVEEDGRARRCLRLREEHEPAPALSTTSKGPTDAKSNLTTLKGTP